MIQQAPSPRTTAPAALLIICVIMFVISLGSHAPSSMSSIIFKKIVLDTSMVPWDHTCMKKILLLALGLSGLCGADVTIHNPPTGHKLEVQDVQLAMKLIAREYTFIAEALSRRDITITIMKDSSTVYCGLTNVEDQQVFIYQNAFTQKGCDHFMNTLIHELLHVAGIMNEEDVEEMVYKIWTINNVTQGMSAIELYNNVPRY